MVNNLKIEEIDKTSAPPPKPAENHDDHANLVKMPPAGFETTFPRKDNYFMTK